MKLSQRQKQLIELLTEGMGNRDIAEHLQISEHTVKVHMWRLFKRIGVASRGQAVAWARTQRERELCAAVEGVLNAGNLTNLLPAIDHLSAAYTNAKQHFGQGARS